MVHTNNAKDSVKFADALRAPGKKVLKALNHQLRLSLWLMQNRIEYKDVGEVFPTVAAGIERIQEVVGFPKNRQLSTPTRAVHLCRHRLR